MHVACLTQKVSREVFFAWRVRAMESLIREPPCFTCSYLNLKTSTLVTVVVFSIPMKMSPVAFSYKFYRHEQTLFTLHVSIIRQTDLMLLGSEGRDQGNIILQRGSGSFIFAPGLISICMKHMIYIKLFFL